MIILFFRNFVADRHLFGVVDGEDISVVRYCLDLAAALPAYRQVEIAFQIFLVRVDLKIDDPANIEIISGHWYHQRLTGGRHTATDPGFPLADKAFLAMEFIVEPVDVIPSERQKAAQRFSVFVCDGQQNFFVRFADAFAKIHHDDSL